VQRVCIAGETLRRRLDVPDATLDFAVLSDIHGQRWIAINVLNGYLGPKTGPRILAGQIRWGTGEELTVVFWSSNLRGFTER
jgi:hypothetical protein